MQATTAPKDAKSVRGLGPEPIRLEISNLFQLPRALIEGATQHAIFRLMCDHEGLFKPLLPQGVELYYCRRDALIGLETKISEYVHILSQERAAELASLIPPAACRLGTAGLHFTSDAHEIAYLHLRHLLVEKPFQDLSEAFGRKILFQAEGSHSIAEGLLLGAKGSI